MNLKQRQRLILQIVAYLPAFMNLVLLILLAEASGDYPYYLEMFTVYGIGALITITISSFILKKYKAIDAPFEKTFWSIAIAYIPTMISLLVINLVYSL